MATYPNMKKQSIQGTPLTIVCTESGGIPAGCAVTIEGKLAATGLTAVGIALFDTLNGAPISVARPGSKVVGMFGGSVSATNPLKVTTGGKLVAYSTGVDSADLLFAIAEEGGGDTEYGLVLIR